MGYRKNCVALLCAFVLVLANFATVAAQEPYRRVRLTREAYIAPEFYGGRYVGEGGQIVFLIVESYLETAMAYDSGCPLLTEGINYRFVEFSYAELHAAQHAVWDVRSERFVGLRELPMRIDELCIYSNNVSGSGIFTMRNRIVVGLVEYNEDMIAGFRRYVYDSPMIEFEHMGWIYLSGGPLGFIRANFTSIVIFIGIGVFILICIAKDISISRKAQTLVNTLTFC